MSDAKIQPGNAGSLLTRATPAVVLQLSVDLLFKYNPACELNTDRLEKKLWKREKKKSWTILKRAGVITYKLFAQLKCAKPKQIKCSREYDSRRVKVISTKVKRIGVSFQSSAWLWLPRQMENCVKKGRNCHQKLQSDADTVEGHSGGLFLAHLLQLWNPGVLCCRSSWDWMCWRNPRSPADPSPAAWSAPPSEPLPWELSKKHSKAFLGKNQTKSQWCKMVQGSCLLLVQNAGFWLWPSSTWRKTTGENGEGLFPRIYSDRTMGNSFKLTGLDGILGNFLLRGLGTGYPGKL